MLKCSFIGVSVCVRAHVSMYGLRTHIKAYEKNSDEAVGMKVSAWGFKKDMTKREMKLLA